MKDPLEIKVRATTHCNDLANSIVAAWKSGKEITVSAIGPVPVATAVKAICVANRYLISGGVLLVALPGLIMKPIKDQSTGAVIDMTVTVLKLRNGLEAFNG